MIDVEFKSNLDSRWVSDSAIFSCCDGFAGRKITYFIRKLKEDDLADLLR